MQLEEKEQPPEQSFKRNNAYAQLIAQKNATI